MVLGAGLVDPDGEPHAMSALLPLQTSFAERRLHLGYRRARLATDCALGARGGAFRGHEFHYAVIDDEGGGEPLFRCDDARGRALGTSGRRAGTVFGSFLHLIDREDETDAR
jgi:cobyrinic acid a,c-diamide synthase